MLGTKRTELGKNLSDCVNLLLDLMLHQLDCNLRSVNGDIDVEETSSLLFG
jgi:hypothetical protein